MKKEEDVKSGPPLMIIGAVIVLAALGAWWFYTSSKSSPGNRNTSSNRSATPSNASNTANSDVAARAPAGAQPPNMLGSPTAMVTVEEFADFQCPSCGTTHPVMKQIQSIYGSRIKFIFRNFPLQMHDKAYDAAVAAEAAGMQGRDKFWAMQNQLYTNQQAWTNDPNYRQVFVDYAKTIGLDVDRFQSDMAGIAAKSRVDADLQRGRALQVGSTPTVYINGRSIPYPELNVNDLRQIIDAEMQVGVPASNSTTGPVDSTGKGEPASNSAASPANSTGNK